MTEKRYLFTRTPIISVRCSDGNYWVPYEETLDKIMSSSFPGSTAIEIAMEDSGGMRGAWQNEDWPY